MKVSVHEIGIEKDEFIDLYIHEKNKSIDILLDYIDNEKYASIKWSCDKKEEIFKIKSDDIYYIETSRDKLLVHTRNEIYEYKNRLYELEKILPCKCIRISKSTILNLEMVMSYNPMFNGLMEVKLNNLEITYISRKYLKEVRERIKGGIE